MGILKTKRNGFNKKTVVDLGQAKGVPAQLVHFNTKLSFLNRNCKMHTQQKNTNKYEKATYRKTLTKLEKITVVNFKPGLMVFSTILKTKDLDRKLVVKCTLKHSSKI